jgi:hypothetical protein
MTPLNYLIYENFMRAVMVEISPGRTAEPANTSMTTIGST